ncbi:hypothetical protein Tco_0691265, partial [Tanacetum coccineum]
PRRIIHTELGDGVATIKRRCHDIHGDVVKDSATASGRGRLKVVVDTSREIAAALPLKYLGVPVGCNMARCSNWDAIFQKFSSKLTLWNARLLSTGGRLSLIKSVLGSLPTYYMSLYKVPVFVCNKLESMRNNFFIGGDLDEKKMSWAFCLN